MHAARFLVVILFLLCASVASASEGEPVRFFYAVKQKVLEVERFEDGLPVLDREAEVGASEGLESSDEGRWRVTGHLPLEFGWASPLTDYQVRIVEPSYRERDLGARVEVPLKMALIPSMYEWEGSTTGDFLVFAWVFGGKAVDYFVTTLDTASQYRSKAVLRIDEVSRRGMPFVWRVSGSMPLKRSNSQVWEEMCFRSEPLQKEVYASWATKRDEWGQSAGHLAAANGLDTHLAELLAANRKMVRAESTMGSGLLRFAIQAGRLETVEQLLAAKAPERDQDSRYNSLLFLATLTGNLEVLKALAPTKTSAGRLADERSIALMSALNRNYETQVSHLLDVGATFTVKNMLQLAYSKFSDGYPELGFRLLDRFKLDVRKSDQGFNLLHIVAPYADVELLERVRALGPDIAELNTGGMTPMDVAVGMGNVEAICWFIENGGRREDGEGIDPVRYAIEMGKKESVECLIDYGYGMNREIAAGVTPAMYAAYLARMDIVSAVLEAGGSWNLENPFMALVWTRILQLDAGEVAASILEQGWTPERSIALDLDLPRALEFYKAETVGSVFRSVAGSVNGEAYRGSRTVESPPRPLDSLALSYPEPMQKKYGDLDLVLELVINREGSIVAWKPRENLGDDLRQLIESDLLNLRFSPASDAGETLPVAFTVRVSLKAVYHADNVFSLDEVEEIPQAIDQATPMYPFELMRKRQTGRVVVECVLDSEGIPHRPRVVSSTHREFENPAIVAVMRSTFSPARSRGVPVAVRIRVPIEFSP